MALETLVLAGLHQLAWVCRHGFAGCHGIRTDIQPDWMEVGQGRRPNLEFLFRTPEVRGMVARKEMGSSAESSIWGWRGAVLVLDSYLVRLADVLEHCTGGFRGMVARKGIWVDSCTGQFF